MAEPTDPAPTPRGLAARLARVTAGYSPDEDRPLGAYAATLGAYAGFVGALVGLGVVGRRSLPRRVPAGDLAVLAVATHKLARVLSKDVVTSVLRAPFTRYVRPQGESELEEEPRGSGGRRAVGELVTCPFCASQWAATALVGGYVLAPRATRLAAAVLAATAGSDFLHNVYATVQQKANG